MKTLFISILLSLSITTLIAQPSNNDCSNATELCISKTKKGNTNEATAQLGTTNADGATVRGATCFDLVKTIWYKFTTNSSGGNAVVSLSNLVMSSGSNGLSGIVYKATTPCNSSSYTAVSNCVSNATSNFSLNSSGLAANTTYYILISSDSSGSCQFDISISGSAVVLPPSTITISNDIGSNIICPEDFVTFTASTTNCQNPIVFWFVNNDFAGTTTGTNPLVRNYFVNKDTVKAEVECDCGDNAKSNKLNINVHPYIRVDAGPYTNIPFGSSTQLNGSGGVSYSWAPTESLDNPNIKSPISTPLVSTNYVMTAKSAEGCNFYSNVTVNIIDSIFIPNTFTPNGDGVNDTWQINLIDLFPKAEVIVYDRWGQVVFKTIGYPTSKRWDGTRKGKKLPATTYYYSISLSIDSKEERIRTGTITIIL